MCAVGIYEVELKLIELGTKRAQAFNIVNLELVNGETIAERIKRDHNDTSSHLRVADMMYEAGCAECTGDTGTLYGIYIFEDGSKF